MSFPSALDSRALHNWATRAVGELTRRRDELNALNVFPVPDSDTGSNMAHTMEAALAEVDKGGDVAEGLAVGSVRGARGNSGMVLSQVLRAVADSTNNSRVDGAVLAQALGLAVRLVDRAIADPMEGTVLSVLRSAAEAAQEACEESGPQLHGVLKETIRAARVALRKTPSQLSVLREAGVVDAGGAGLLLLLEAMLAELEGAGAVESTAWEDKPAAELEVMFFFHGDLAALEESIRPLGNSLVIARESEERGSIHIHTTAAGRVIETAFALGEVSNLRLEVLPEQPAGQDTEANRTTRKLFVAAPAGPIADLFASVGASVVSPHQDLDTSHPADIFLTNGQGGDPGQARVVNNSFYVEGLAALSVYEMGNPDTDAMVATMRDAVRSMRVAQPASEELEAVEDTARELLSNGGEQVTILSSWDIDAERLGKQLGVETIALTIPGIATEIGVE